MTTGSDGGESRRRRADGIELEPDALTPRLLASLVSTSLRPADAELAASVVELLVSSGAEQAVAAYLAPAPAEPATFEVIAIPSAGTSESSPPEVVSRHGSDLATALREAATMAAITGSAVRLDSVAGPLRRRVMEGGSSSGGALRVIPPGPESITGDTAARRAALVAWSRLGGGPGPEELLDILHRALAEVRVELDPGATSNLMRQSLAGVTVDVDLRAVEAAVRAAMAGATIAVDTAVIEDAVRRAVGRSVQESLSAHDGSATRRSDLARRGDISMLETTLRASFEGILQHSLGAVARREDVQSLRQSVPVQAALEQGLRSIVDAWASTFEHRLSVLTEAIQAADRRSGERAEAIDRAIAAAGEAAESVTTDAAVATTEAIASTTEAIAATNETIAATAGAVAAAIESATATTTEAITAAIDASTATATAAITAATEAATEATTGATTEAIHAATDAIGGEILAAVGQTAGSLADALQALHAGNQAAAKQLINAITEATADLPETIRSTADRASDESMEWIESRLESVTQSLSAAISASATRTAAAAEDLSQQLHEAEAALRSAITAGADHPELVEVSRRLQELTLRIESGPDFQPILDVFSGRLDALTAEAGGVARSLASSREALDHLLETVPDRRSLERVSAERIGMLEQRFAEILSEAMHQIASLRSDLDEATAAVVAGSRSIEALLEQTSAETLAAAGAAVVSANSALGAANAALEAATSALGAAEDAAGSGGEAASTSRVAAAAIEALTEVVARSQQETAGRDAETVNRLDELQSLIETVNGSLESLLATATATSGNDTADADDGADLARAALVSVSERLNVQLDAFADRVRASTRSLQGLADELTRRDGTALLLSEQMSRSFEAAIERLADRLEARIERLEPPAAAPAPEATRELLERVAEALERPSRTRK